MTRRYSHCNGNAQNSRSGSGPRLFGVRLTDGSFIKKSASMGSLSHHHSPMDSPDGYHSDDIIDDNARRPLSLRKKGVAWTEPEHRQFLLGLEQLGRGNWRAISRNYVPTRTPTQVASHAQKYYLRLSSTNESGRRKRPSLFDLPTDMETDSPQQEQSSMPFAGAGGSNGEVMLSSVEEEDMNNPPPSLDLSLKPPFTPFQFQLWPPNAYSVNDNGGEASQHQIHRPVQEEPIKEMVSMSQLKLG